MPRKERLLEEPAVLFAAIERAQHESLRRLAFETHRSIADIAREALEEYLGRHGTRNARTPKPKAP